eukprot:scaffold3246_cov104-Skeletonema_dohrnii-CCMP3373.AAC.3
MSNENDTYELSKSQDQEEEKLYEHQYPQVDPYFYLFKANVKKPPRSVDCHLHSVRYDMAVNRGAGGRLRCIIRSPTTLIRPTNA